LELTPEDVNKALAGDTRARRRLVDVLQPAIQGRVVQELFRRRALALRRDVRQEVDDMTQQVFVSLLEDGGRALRAWSPARGLSLVDFVGLLTARQVASILRSGRRSPWKEDSAAEDVFRAIAAADPGPEVLAAARDLGETIIERLRDELSPKGLALFELIFVREAETQEVAEAYGMSMESVYAWRSRIGRLTRRIAEELQEGAGRKAAEGMR
jgi:RNA polymerase sigma-70 factor (ECF subfamily)